MQHRGRDPLRDLPFRVSYRCEKEYIPCGWKIPLMVHGRDTDIEGSMSSYRNLHGNCSYWSYQRIRYKEGRPNKSNIGQGIKTYNLWTYLLRARMVSIHVLSFGCFSVNSTGKPVEPVFNRRTPYCVFWKCTPSREMIIISRSDSTVTRARETENSANESLFIIHLQPTLLC